MTKTKLIGLFILLYGLLCLLSLNRHSQAKLNTYHAELWADKAGYNVYLPALFIYNFDAKQLPTKLEANTGNGFIVDSISNKLITKYPYGVALLQSPFWLVAHTFSSQKDGYSLYYQKSIDFAGSFYLTLGLFFLYFFIRRYQTVTISVLLSILIALSTGIFYYGIYETGMSHIYSFCCLSIILFLITDVHYFQKYFFCLLIVSVIYIIIRPINSVFLVPLFLFFSWQQHMWLQLKQSFTVKNSLLFVLILGVLLMPQLLYYKYAFGSFFTMSYKNEPFVFPSLTRIFELLFSPNNGLLIYYPVIVLLAVYYFLIKNSYNKLVFFLLALYVIIYAAWWSLSLGCGFGHRAINDIFLILFLPIILSKQKLSPFLLSALFLFALINLKFILSFDTCLHYSNQWNFTEYFAILFGEFK